MSLLHTHISKIEDRDIQSLIGELKDATMAYPDPALMLLHYLQSCHHPGGASEKWLPIEKNQITPERFLSRKIGKLNSQSVHQLCDEIAKMSGLSVEAVESMHLYTFFNKHTPHLFKKQRKKPHDPRDTLRRMGY